MRQLTNAAGAETDSYEYDAFGNQISHTGSTPNEFLYRGEQYDSTLGLYYLRARYMNPVTGRFMSRDPDDGDITNPATLHKYAFANDDPVDDSDPTGRAAIVMPPPTQAPGGIGDEGSGAASEYALILATVVIPTTTAVHYVGERLSCMYSTEASTVNAINQFLGSPQQVIIDWEGCSATSSSPGTAPEPTPTPSPAPTQKPGTCTQLHPDWPVNLVQVSATPMIAAHIAAAQAAGYPDALTYLGPNNPQRDANYQAACGSGKYKHMGMSCDEYPYASTAQGGAGASTAPVSIQEQRKQGGLLGGFYRGLPAGQNFCVEVIP